MTMQPWWTGQTRPLWKFTLRLTDNTAQDITGATFTGSMREVRTGVVKTLTPANFAITTAASGKFTYAPVAADVDTAGTWTILIVLTISGELYKSESEIIISQSY